MKKLLRTVALGVLALGLLIPAQTAQAATPVYTPQINTCRYVTVPPKLPYYAPACWNFLGNQPTECKSTRVWKCFAP